MSDRELFSMPLSILNKIGLLVQNKSSQGYIIIPIIATLILLFNMTEMAVLLFVVEKTVMNYVKNLEGIAAFSQTFGKTLICFFIKNEYLELFKLSEGFLKAEESVTDTQLTNINQISHNLIFVQKFYYYFGISVAFVCMFSSFIFQELVFSTWLWEQNIYYWCIWLTLSIDLLYTACFVSNYDNLFLGFCYDAIIQCKILQYNLESLSVNNINNELDYEVYCQKCKSCINHHIILLRYHSQMQKVYSSTLVLLLFSNGPLTCVEAYALMSESLTLLIRYGVCILILIVQLIFYCLPIGFLDNEMSLIANAVYNSDWNSKHFSSLRIPIVVLIQMAQRKIALTAYGLIEFNANTLVRILRVAFSTCLALQNIK